LIKRNIKKIGMKENTKIVTKQTEVDLSEILPANMEIKDVAVEPLLQPNNNRFVLFPIQHDDIWDMYKKTRSFYLDS